MRSNLLSSATRFRRFLSLVALLVIGAFSAGCSIHPLVDDVTRKTTYDIVEQIRCEAKRAILDHAAPLRNAAIAYEFTFDIAEANDAAGVIGVSYPFFTGTASLGVGAKANRARNANRNFKLVDSFDDLRAAQCAPEILEKNWIYPIAGEIGIYEVVATFVRLHKAENPVGSEVFSFADTLTFVSFFSGGVNPKLTLSPITKRLRVTEATAELNATRRDDHKLVLALSGGVQPVTGRRSVGRARIGAPLMGREGMSSIGALNTNSSILSTTLIQDASDAKGRALLELDRQRILDLQARTTNLLVGP